jgi:hypothetical protein
MVRTLLALMLLAVPVAAFAQSSGATSDSERGAAAGRESGCNPCSNGASSDQGN